MAWARFGLLGDRRFVQLLLMTLAIGAAVYARFSLGPLQEALRTDMGLSDDQVALVQGPAIALPMAIGAIPLGLVVNRVPRHLLFGLALALAMSGGFLSAAAGGLELLLAARCLTGVALSVITIAAYAAVGDLYPPEQRGRATMLVALGEVGGAPLAFAVGGVILDARGLGAAGWREALLIMTAGLSAAAISMLALRSGTEATEAPLAASARRLFAELWRHRGLVAPLLLARVVLWVADGAVLVWGAPTLSRRFGLSASEVGASMGAVLLISGLVGPLLGGPLADFFQRRGGARSTMRALAAMAGLSVPAAMFAFAPTPLIAVIALGVFLCLGYMIGTAALTLATVVIPAPLRPLYLAISVTLVAVFFIGAAPVAVSGLADLMGGPGSIGSALSLVCAAASVAGTAVLLASARGFPGR